MRLWALLLVAVMCGCVSGQLRGNRRRDRNGQSNGGSEDPNLKLGLVSSTLGVPAVPGGHNSNLVGTRPPQTTCFCLPINQVCPDINNNNNNNHNNNGNSGGGGNPGFDVRIVNRPTATSCTISDQRLCCPGVGPTGPRPVPVPAPIPGGLGRPFPPVQPNPFPHPTGPREPPFPQPVQVGTCGVQNPLPYRNAQHAQADFGEYPWMAVVLDLKNNYVGGGVLIHPQWVLTAAHKVYQLQPNNMKVRLGEHDVGKPQDHPQIPHLEVSVSQIAQHPGFDSKKLLNDVALLRLSQPINTNNYPHIGTACLPRQDQLFNGNQKCWVTGWGKDAFDLNGNFQQILKEVDVPMVDPFICQERLRTTRLGESFTLDTHSFTCAGGVAGKDACTGDGGAPLVCQGRNGWTVVGLVAWGVGCAEPLIPGVYVNVPSYINYINRVIHGVQG